MEYVTFTIHGHAREYFPSKERFRHKVTGETTVRRVLEHLGVNPLLVMYVVKNGKRVSLDDPITGGDEVVLITPAAGG